MALRTLSLMALIAGAGVLAYAAVTGQAEVGLLLVVPFIVGSGPLPFAGALLVLLGTVGLVAGTARRLAPPGPTSTSQTAPPDEETTRTEAGGVVMIGPIPIVLGSDRRTAILAALGGVLVLLGLIVVVLLWG